MNAQELAQKMLDWGVKRQELDALEDELRAAVLELGKTQTVGNVRVSYSAGRKSYDYRAAIEGAYLAHGTLDAFEKVTIDFRAACKALDVKDVPFTQGKPTANVKMI